MVVLETAVAHRPLITPVRNPKSLQDINHPHKVAASGATGYVLAVTTAKNGFSLAWVEASAGGMRCSSRGEGARCSGKQEKQVHGSNLLCAAGGPAAQC